MGSFFFFFFYTVFFNASTTAASTSASRYSDPKLATTLPSLPTTYLKKFQVGADPAEEGFELLEDEEDEEEEEPEADAEELEARNLKTGCASAPDTAATLPARRKY